MIKGRTEVTYFLLRFLDPSHGMLRILDYFLKPRDLSRPVEMRNPSPRAELRPQRPVFSKTVKPYLHTLRKGITKHASWCCEKLHETNFWYSALSWGYGGGRMRGRMVSDCEKMLDSAITFWNARPISGEKRRDSGPKINTKKTHPFSSSSISFFTLIIFHL